MKLIKKLENSPIPVKVLGIVYIIGGGFCLTLGLFSSLSDLISSGWNLFAENLNPSNSSSFWSIVIGFSIFIISMKVVRLKEWARIAIQPVLAIIAVFIAAFFIAILTRDNLTSIERPTLEEIIIRTVFSIMGLFFISPFIASIWFFNRKKIKQYFNKSE